MGKDRHTLQCKLFAERKEAMKRCKNEYEDEQCRTAYYHLTRQMVDALQQSRGFAPEVYYRPELATDN